MNATKAFRRAARRYTNMALLSAGVSLILLAVLMASVEHISSWGLTALLVTFFAAPAVTFLTMVYAWLAVWFHGLARLCDSGQCDVAIRAFRRQYWAYSLLRHIVG